MPASWWLTFLLCGLALAVSAILKEGVEKFFRSKHPYQALLAVFVVGGLLGLAIHKLTSVFVPSFANKQFRIPSNLEWPGILISLVITVPLLLNLSSLSKTRRLYERIPLSLHLGVFRLALRSRNVWFFVILLVPPIVVFGILYPLKNAAVPTSMLVAGALLAVNFVINLSIPPAVLLLGSSNWGSARLFGLIDRGIYPYRTVVLFDPVQSEIDRLSQVERANFGPNNLRVLGSHNWKSVVQRIAKMVPLIVVDTRTPSPAVVEETVNMVQVPFRDKVVFVINEDGTAPSIEQAGCNEAAATCQTADQRHIVKALKKLGLTETSSPDDNPLIAQASYAHHCRKLSQLITSADSVAVSLSKAIRSAEEHLGQTPLLADASQTVEQLNGAPGDGALEVYAQLPGDIEAVQSFLHKWQDKCGLREVGVIREMRRMHQRLNELQKAVDSAPVSFHLKNEQVLSARFGRNE